MFIKALKTLRLLAHLGLCMAALLLGACQAPPMVGAPLDGPEPSWVQLFEEAPLSDELFEVRSGIWAKWPNGRRKEWPQFHWTGPHTVVASMWRLDQWVAGNDDLPQNWAFDLKAGTRQRILEDGQIGCATTEHMVIVRSPLEGAASGMLDRPWQQDYAKTRVGSLNRGFTPFADSPLGRLVDAKHPLMSTTCLPAAHAEDFSPPDATLSILRLGNEGFIALNNRGSALLQPGQKPPKQVLTVFNAQKQKVATWDDPCVQQVWPGIQAHIVPVGQQKAYLSLQTGPHPASARICPRTLFRADGHVEHAFDKPTALSTLTEHSVYLIGITPRGPLWHVSRARQSAPWGRAGLYIQNEGGEASLALRGDFHVLSRLSEDGCRLIAARSPEGSILRHAETMPGKERQVSKFISIDFCHWGEQTWR